MLETFDYLIYYRITCFCFCCYFSLSTMKTGDTPSVSHRVFVILYHRQWIHCTLYFACCVFRFPLFCFMSMTILEVWRWLCPVLTSKLQLGCHVMCECLSCCSYLLIYWELTHRQTSAFPSLSWGVKNSLLFGLISRWHISAFHKSYGLTNLGLSACLSPPVHSMH